MDRTRRLKERILRAQDARFQPQQDADQQRGFGFGKRVADGLGKLLAQGKEPGQRQIATAALQDAQTWKSHRGKDARWRRDGPQSLRGAGLARSWGSALSRR